MTRLHTQQFDLDSGIVVSEAFRRDGKLHRDPAEGPARIKRDPISGAVVQEKHFVDGKLHRIDAPAWIEHDPETRVVVFEEWYQNGLMHRDSAVGPARTRRDGATGAVVQQEYRVYAEQHRVGGPSSISWNSRGEITSEEWYRQGRLHRDPKEGPASWWREANGVIPEEEYAVNGELHRDPEDGPARISRNWQTGAIEGEHFYVRGERVTPPRSKGPVKSKAPGTDSAP